MSDQKLIIPFFGTLAEKLKPIAGFLIRIIAGAIFIYHGHGKFMALVTGGDLGWLEGMIADSHLPFPMVLAWLATITEFFGGICIVLGLFTRLWAFLGTGMMLLIVLFVKGGLMDPTNISARGGGYEYDLLLAAVFGLIFVYGAGPWSIDAKLKKTF